MTDGGIEMHGSNEHPLNLLHSIGRKEEDGRSTRFKDEQPLNAHLPIESTEEGMMASSKEQQSSNAPSPIERTEEGIVT